MYAQFCAEELCGSPALAAAVATQSALRPLGSRRRLERRSTGEPPGGHEAVVEGEGRPQRARRQGREPPALGRL